MLRQLILMTVLIALATGSLCPPPCNPPHNISGCLAYKKSSHCRQDWVDVSVSQAVCSCMWQQYIEAAEPDSRVITTEGGEQCYTWATVTCAMEQKESAKIAAEISRDIAAGVSKLQKAILEDRVATTNLPVTEVAKHRKRNGVEFDTKVIQEAISEEGDRDNAPADLQGEIEIETVGNVKDNEGSSKSSSDIDFVGKPEKNGKMSWVEVAAVKPDTNKHAVVVPHHHLYWFPWNMQDDEFKLWMFLGILLLNFLVVILAIFCTTDQKSEPREVRSKGDLDPNMYIQNKSLNKQTHIGNFLRKLRLYKDGRADRRHQYTQMGDGSGQGVPQGYRYTQTDDDVFQSPRRPSGGLYDELTDDTQGLDYSYEEPVFNARDYKPSRYSYNMSMQTDTAEEQPRSVSFSLPPSGQPTGSDNRPKVTRPGGPPILPLGKYFDR